MTFLTLDDVGRQWAPENWCSCWHHEAHTCSVYYTLYAVRAVKKNEDVIRRQRFADAVLDADHRNFWSDIKRIRCSKSGVVDSIAAVFANKYREIYSCVSYNRSDMQRITSEYSPPLPDSDSAPKSVVGVSHRVFHSRLKTHLFSRSFPP